MSQSERHYLLARAERERRSAAEAPDDVVRSIHLRLAHEYDVRANVADVRSKADNDDEGLSLEEDSSS